ncbi:hypothetical protein [Rhizobium sp. BR 362]|uniref:hypothetical protein n=1 Tax=Rhizobium sp. BR 362 TaxID=3040670 RepID=UPI002F404719
MRDICRPEGLQSSVMYVPEAVPGRIWAEWIDRPQHWMDTNHKGGDQAFLESFRLDHASKWQDLCPGQIVSWKSHVRRALYDNKSGNG